MTDQPPAASAPADPEAQKFYYPNRMGRILLLGYEEVMGYNGMHALLKLAGYEHYAQVPPPNNSDKQFPFTAIGGLTGALLRMYGPRGARGVAHRVGAVCAKHGIREYASMMGIADLTFQLLPLSIKLSKGVNAFAALFNDYTDDVVRLEETPDMLYWHVERCSVCWGVQSEAPCCHLAVGLLREGLAWLSGGKDFQVEEQACIAAGDPTCTIAITKVPLD